MAVDVQRDGDAEVPEHLRDYLRADALREQRRGARAPEVVEAYVAHPGPPQELASRGGRDSSQVRRNPKPRPASRPRSTSATPRRARRRRLSGGRSVGLDLDPRRASVGNQAEKPHPLPSVTGLFPHDAGRSRLVARRAHNPKVVGSILPSMLDERSVASSLPVRSATRRS